MTAPAKSPEAMDRDDWDDLYMDCESNGEGQARSMVRYAYEAGYAAARKASTFSHEEHAAYMRDLLKA